MCDVVVVGAGIIGASVAWTLTRAGARGRVRAAAPAPATAASAASFSRATAFGKPPRAYFDLTHAGLRALHRIGAQGAPGFHPSPTLLWARDPDRLDADLARARQWGYAAEEVAPEAPAVPRGVDRAALSPRVVRLPDEGWVDLPAMAGWMVDRARREGAEVRFGARVERILTDAAGAVCGVALADGGRVDAGTVVNAAGAGAEEVAGLVGAQAGNAGRAVYDKAVEKMPITSVRDFLARPTEDEEIELIEWETHTSNGTGPGAGGDRNT